MVANNSDSHSKSAREPENLFVLDAVTGDYVTFLSGRRELITEIANRLSGSKHSCIIYGERGVGKTTVAWQVASVLEGTNTFFSRDKILKMGKDYEIECVFYKCNSDIQSVSDLLFDILTDTTLEHSFARKYRSRLDRTRISKLSHKFKFNLFSVFGYETQVDQKIDEYPSDVSSLASLKSESQIKRELFEALASEIVSVDGEGVGSKSRKLVVFVDEFDRATIPKLGEYIKDNNLVQFVFVGIANNSTEILLDHKSAGRKLSGGSFRVPLLSDDEIIWIYRNAEYLSGNAVVFDEDYMEEARNYSGGMPWIAQHVGYNSLFQKTLSSEINSWPLVLDKADFQNGVKKAIEIYEEEACISLDFSVVGKTQMTGERVLEAIWERANGVTVDEIVEIINNPKMNRYVEKVLIDLVGANILKKVGSKYFYYDPVIRIFVRNYLQQKKY